MSRSARHKRNRQQYAVSLFPFLAVLVCTLGVLIVMLVMAVQQADVQGRHQRDDIAAQQQQQLKEAQERRVLADFESESIMSVRGELTTRLRDAKGDRSYLQQQIRDTTRQAEDIFKAIANLNALPPTDPVHAGQENPDREAAESAAAKEIERLRSDVASAEKTLEQLRADKSFETRTEYAIIPFTGSGGTHRQPIFVECVGDGIVLQPYDIKLKRSEFTHPLPIGNMLDSALLTVREYWDRHGLAATDSKPYPLLVVRPEGAESYGLARRAMKSWDDEFGYELVNSDVELRFGKPDPNLKMEIEAAVKSAKQRQQRIVRRRRFERNDQQATRLQLPRGLQPSASGGFEFTDTGEPAYELIAEKNRGQHISPPLSRASFNQAPPENGARGQKLQQSPDQKYASDDSAAYHASADRRSYPQNVTHGSNLQSGSPNAVQGNATAGSSTSSLANSRGANWALPSQTTGARAYVRPMRLVCESDAISLVSENVVTARIPLGAQTVASIDPLVSEVWKTIETWGIAGRQAYWKPELRFSVVPGAERRLEEIQSLLDNSGLLVKAAHER